MTRVLVVDDEPQILRALAINLRARGYDVRTAGSGAEALATAAAHPPELVVLDLGLPDMEGTEVIAGLRGWTGVPVLVLSGRSDSTDKVEALDAGADDYVTKPFGMDELLARMRAMVPARRPQGDDQPVVGSATPSSTWRPARSCATGRGPAHSHGVAPARGARAPPGPPAQPAAAAGRGLGARATRAPRATCGSTWASCVASSSPTRPGRDTCSTSPAWATASSPASPASPSWRRDGKRPDLDAGRGRSVRLRVLAG